jgi:pSer/pThr/pTyr-binding forkhead associated (FHA) protein
MPNLTLNFKDTTLEDYRLQKGHSLTIGRLKNNDVTIENLAVSGHHAKIDSVADGFVLIDLQSKNGSFVNEQLVNSHWLKNGDVISIGKHSLLFSYSEDEVMPDEGSDEMEETMAIDTSQYRNMMKKSNSKVPKPLTKGNNNNNIVGILTYLAGGNGKIKLNGKITKLGKHRTSDIVVKGLFVGRTSVTISRRPDGFYLSYVGGLSKPKLNKKAVKQSAILNDLDIIDIGSTKLQFFIQKPHQKKKKMI